MKTAKILYIGDLRTEATHVKSGEKIVTDAPTDNHGKGAAFSPTDLLATSLGTCIITTMDIVAKRHNINIIGTKIDVTKIMVSDPRKVGEIIVEIEMPKNNYSEEDKSLLERTAQNCPVAKSLHPDLKQTIIFNY